MKNAMQLKAIIKNIAKEKSISAQLVLQNFMMERLLERISVSSYRDHFILKGGFLIAAMVGLDTRATMDMDATIKGIPLSEQTLKNMFFEILFLLSRPVSRQLLDIVREQVLLISCFAADSPLKYQ